MLSSLSPISRIFASCTRITTFSLSSPPTTAFTRLSRSSGTLFSLLLEFDFFPLSFLLSLTTYLPQGWHGEQYAGAHLHVLLLRSSLAGLYGMVEGVSHAAPNVSVLLQHGRVDHLGLVVRSLLLSFILISIWFMLRTSSTCRSLTAPADLKCHGDFISWGITLLANVTFFYLFFQMYLQLYRKPKSGDEVLVFLFTGLLFLTLFSGLVQGCQEEEERVRYPRFATFIIATLDISKII